MRADSSLSVDYQLAKWNIQGISHGDKRIQRNAAPAIHNAGYILGSNPQHLCQILASHTALGKEFFYSGVNLSSHTRLHVSIGRIADR